MSEPDSLNPTPPTPPDPSDPFLTPAERIKLQTDGRHVCPYCGNVTDAREGVACERCGMEDTGATRGATTARVGPWSVLQTRNPAAPGMNFATLLALVRKGQVTATSVVRGPTTQQLWTFAAQVKGLSKEFGVCYGCGRELQALSNACPNCKRVQDPPADPDALLETAGQQARAAEERARVTTPPPGVGLAAARSAELAARGSTGVPGQSRILTPKELAAAFALSVPEEEAAVARGLGKETEEQEPGRRPRRGGRGRRVLVALVVLGGLAGAGYLAYDPGARAEARRQLVRAGEWVKVQWARGVDWVRSGDKGTKAQNLGTAVPGVGSGDRGAAAEETGVEAAADREGVRAADREVPAAVAASATTKAAWVEGPGVKAEPEPAKGEVAVTHVAKPTVAGPSVPAAASVRVGPPQAEVVKVVREVPQKQQVGRVEKVQERAGATAGAGAAQAKVAATAPALGPGEVTAEAEGQASKWFLQALEAEQRGDYAGAVKLYERIKGLPRGAWPAGLERRLEAARGRAG